MKDVLYQMRGGILDKGLSDLIYYMNQFIDTKEINMIEIGSYSGESTTKFAQYFKNVVAIDPFIDDYDPNDLIMDFAPMSMVYESFQNNDISKCEFHKLYILWKNSQNIEKHKILYLHTKGVTKPHIESIKDWTEYLSHFNITNWKERIEELNNFDCTGVDLKGNVNDINEPPQTWGYGKAPIHYSGIFWWSTSEHIKRLINTLIWIPDNNYFRWGIMAEMWVCQFPDGLHYSAFNSNVNFYNQRYLKKEYIK